jgi:hypothetical protein
MGLEVRRAISLHKNMVFTEDQLFNSLIDLTIGSGVDEVMARIPADYRVRFRDWLDRQPDTENLLDLRSGPVSKQDRDTVAAIREWLDGHTGVDARNGDASRPREPGMPLDGHITEDQRAEEPIRPAVP